MAGYTRQDTANNIANGNVIDADDFDAEYNAVESAFNASTGHKHDGTAGEGAPITKVGPSQDLVVSATTVNPKTTNTLDLGTSSIEYKDAFFDGTVKTDALVVDETTTLTGIVTASSDLSVGGNLSVTGNATINGNLTFGDADTDSVSFGADITSSLIPDGSTQDLGTLSKQWRDLYINGTANIDDLQADSVNIDGGNIDGTIIGANTQAAISGTTISASTGFAGNLAGNVTGIISDISNHDTDALTEGSSNLYFTEARARNSMSVTDGGGDGSLTYTSATGVIAYVGPSASETRAHFSATDAGGDGSFSYNNSTGVFTYTGPSATETRAHFTSGEGINISGGSISGEDATISNKGIASFADADFSVASGAVSLKADRVQDIVGGMVQGNTESGLSVTYQSVDGTLDFSLTKDPTITLTGDVTGSGTMTNLGNVSIATTIGANKVALGTDTTGNYVSGATGGTGVSISGTAGEGWSPTISIGQAVATNSNVTFNNISAGGTLGVTGNTTLSGTLGVTGTSTFSGTVNVGSKTIAEYIEDTVGGMVAGNTESGISVSYVDTDGTLDFNVNDPTITLTGDVTGSATMTNLGNVSIATTVAANKVALGTDTTGAYVSSLVAGTGVSVSNNSGETATPTISIGQAVATNSNVQFNNLTVAGNQTVSGTTTTVNTETINLADNIINLNSNHTGAPTQDSGIRVERGTLSDVTFAWDESEDEWSTFGERLKVGTLEATTLQGSLAHSSLTGVPDPTLTLAGDATGNCTFTNLGNATLTVAVVNDSHTHDGRYYTETESDSRFTASAGDVMTGTLRFNDNVIASFGSSNDAEFFCNGSHMYLDLNSGIGNFYIRDGSTNKFTFNDNGSFTATDDITAFSDARLKDNVQTIDGALDKVAAMRGVTYHKNGKQGTGVIAQEMQEVMPEVVMQNDEYLSVAYGNLVGVLIEAVKELKAEVEELKKG